ncbi:MULTISPECIES: iron ABC transporter permease [unclassified Chelatococcus]|uniref:ABC transporter permease n=1 Tax=unclassified Chelatococcus TaxID=2638111 RepID=UPI001BCEC013|nr:MULTISPECIES: iron ABC transporter permease [unclassified Chelatococcus]MBS7701545.1 iron ABC transporter permease [Chelatococcus sp. YT9]MBX3557380.1 iron ABC transporter permease [Chelatococcus sp.]
MKKRISTFEVSWLALGLILFGVVVVPLLLVLNSAFYSETDLGLSTERSFQAVINVYATREYLTYLANALLLASAVTVAATVVGVTIAILVARTDIPYKSAIDLFVTMPIFLSPLTGLIAWIFLGSSGSGYINLAIQWVTGSNLTPINIWSFAGVVWIMFLFFCPFVYLFTLGSLRSMDSSLEEASRMSGASVFTTLRRITLPMSLPAIFASSLLVFILAAEMYTIPGLIGSNANFTTLPWQVYKDTTMFPTKQAHAAAAGTMLLWIALIGVWVQQRITRVSERYITVAGKGFRGNPLKLGSAKWPALVLLALYILSADILPFGTLLIASFMKYSSVDFFADNLWTTKHYYDIWNLPKLRLSLINTAVLAVITGVSCVVFGLLTSYAEIRRPSPATKMLAFIGVLPVAVPGLVYGLGVMWTYVQTPLYGTIWILFLAYVAKFLPYGILVSRSGILQIHGDLEQSARMSGATQMQAMRHITMPLIKITLIAILFFVMIMSIKEVSASILLATAKNQVLSVLTWAFIDSGNYQLASAIGVVQTVMMLALVYLTRVIFRVKLENAIG